MEFWVVVLGEESECMMLGKDSELNLLVPEYGEADI